MKKVVIAKSDDNGALVTEFCLCCNTKQITLLVNLYENTIYLNI